MGNVQSRQRYYEAAYEATHNARELQRDIRGPRIRGAILAYIENRISAEHMTRACTQLEANEFQRLAEPTYFRWIHRNNHLFRCQPRRGRCRYPDDNIHSGLCEYYEPLPPDVDVNGPAYIQDWASYDGFGATIEGCNYGLRDCPYGDTAYDSDGYSDESSDLYSDEESEYSGSGYAHEYVSYREPGFRGNSHEVDPLDRIFTRLSDMRLRRDEYLGRNALDHETFASNSTYADGFLPLSAERTRSLHHSGRTSGRTRGTTATRGGRQANTRSPPPIGSRRGATWPEGRSGETRPNPSRGRGGMNSRGRSRGGNSRATHTTRPRSPIAHDEFQENRPNSYTGRGGMGLPGQGGMALGGRGGMFFHGRSRGGPRHATHTSRPRSPIAHDGSRQNPPNTLPGSVGMGLPGQGGMSLAGRGGMALGGRGSMISHGRSRGGNRHATRPEASDTHNESQEDPQATRRESRIPTIAPAPRDTPTGGTKLPTRPNFDGSRGGPARGDGSSNAAGVVASEQGASHQGTHPTNIAEQRLEAHNTEDDMQAPPGAVIQPAAHSRGYGGEGPSRADNSSSAGEGISGTDAIASRHSREVNAPLEVSEEESDSVLVCTPPPSPQQERHFQSLFESDSEDEYEIVEEGVNGGTG